MWIVAGRTFAIGDVHGDLAQLRLLMSRLPTLEPADTVVFLGDYIDRGPDSAGVVAYLRELPRTCPARVVTLRGNHEDAWLTIVERGWPEFVLPRGNGCYESYRSFLGLPPPEEYDVPTSTEFQAMCAA